MQNGNNILWKYPALICYSLFTVLILVFKPEIWWALLIAILISESVIRFVVFAEGRQGTGNLLSHPIENGLESLYSEYKETNNLRLTATIRNIKALFVWRWIIFSGIINLLSLPHSVAIPYLPLLSMDAFIESQTSERDYPLMITIYTLEYLVYIVFAFIADIIILFLNSVLISLLPNLLSINIYKKLNIQYPLPPKIKKKVFKIIDKVNRTGITSLTPKEKIQYNMFLNSYNIYLKKIKDSEGK